MFKEPLDLGSIIRKIKTITDSAQIAEPIETDDGTVLNVSSVDMVSEVVGACIGSNIPVPDTKVPLPKAWLSANYGKQIREVLAEINEATIINISKAYSTACAMFESRYNIIHNEDVTLAQLFDILSSRGDFVSTSVLSIHESNYDGQLEKLFQSLNFEIKRKKADTRSK